jgi:hypothetical protein
MDDVAKRLADLAPGDVEPSEVARHEGLLHPASTEDLE